MAFHEYDAIVETFWQVLQKLADNLDGPALGPASQDTSLGRLFTGSNSKYPRWIVRVRDPLPVG